MGNKVSPNGLRYGVNKQHQSRWYATDNKDLAKWILQDYQIRKALFAELKTSGVSKIEIERTKSQIILFIHCVRVGSVLGQGAENLKKLTLLVNKVIAKYDSSQLKVAKKTLLERQSNIKINVVEIKNPEIDAQNIANTIATSIEGRASYRTTQKFAVRKALRAGALGIKTSVSGRLGDADMARTEGYSEGSVPLATLRSNIDYAHAEANTTFGKIGVKIWVYKGEILKGNDTDQPEIVNKFPNVRNNRRPNNNRPASQRREAK